MPSRPPGPTCGGAQRPVADDPRAEQRGGLLVVEAVGQDVGEALVHETALGVPSVDVPTGERRCGAEVLAPRAAVAAGAVGGGEPRDPDPLPDDEPRRPAPDGVDDSDDLVAGDDSVPTRCQVALGEVQVGAAHAAAPDPDPGLAGARQGIRALGEDERPRRDRPGPIDHPCAHRPSLARCPEPSPAVRAVSRGRAAVRSRAARAWSAGPHREPAVPRPVAPPSAGVAACGRRN